MVKIATFVKPENVKGKLKIQIINTTKMKKRNALLTVAVFLGMTFGLTAQNVPSYVPTNGLVGWWPFNGNANDESGNGNNGTVNGATLTADRFGSNNKAYYFNGTSNTSEYIELTNPFISGNTISISYWVKRNQSPGFSWHLMMHGSNATYELVSSNDSIIFRNFNRDLGLSNFDIKTSVNFLSEEYFHICFSSNGAINELFINGIKKSELSSTLLPALTGEMHFGKHSVFPNSSGFAHNGSMDDIAIYNRPLTQQEITALYQGGNSTANCLDLPTNLQQGLVGYWPFCGNALDESGNGNHGTVNGATLTADRFGNAEKAYRFEQNNQNSIMGTLSNFTPSTFSISLWGKHKTGQTGNGPINGNQPFEWLFGIGSPTAIAPTNEGLAFGVYDNTSTISTGSWGNLFTTGATIDTIWKNYIITYENNILKIFQGGVLVSQNPVTFNISSFPFCFGRQLMGINEFWNGSLDDIAIWNRALSQSEITQLYNQGICKTSITVTDTLLIHTGITSYYPVAYQNTLKV